MINGVDVDPQTPQLLIGGGGPQTQKGAIAVAWRRFGRGKFQSSEIPHLVGLTSVGPYPFKREYLPQ